MEINDGYMHIVDTNMSSSAPSDSHDHVTQDSINTVPVHIYTPVEVGCHSSTNTCYFGTLM